MMRDSVSGVGVLDKAAVILDALGQGPMTLVQLAAATGLPRATAHRLAVALTGHRLVARDLTGRFELGPRMGELARAATTSRRNLAEQARPALMDLRDTTGESAQLYVVRGEERLCVASLESPHSLRTIVAVGAALPIDRGSAGKVLRTQPGGETLRWAQSIEEREPGVASVSAPVLLDGRVIAAVSVSGPIQRTSREPGRRYAEAVVAAARAIETAMS